VQALYQRKEQSKETGYCVLSHLTTAKALPCLLTAEESHLLHERLDNITPAFATSENHNGPTH